MKNRRKVEVLSNRSESRDKFENGYQVNDPLVVAISFFVEGGSDDEIAERTFEALNREIGIEESVVYGTLRYDDVSQYHFRFPSLSIGDVVRIDGTAYAVDRIGFRRVEVLDLENGQIPWLPVVDVAKLIRKILKGSYPEIKFSVRSKKYAGGASIDVSYWDGPQASKVEALIKHLQHNDYMDNTDYVHTKVSIHGTKTFHSGAGYIFVKRDYSKAITEEVARKVIEDYGLETKVPVYRESKYGTYIRDSISLNILVPHTNNLNLPELINQTLRDLDASDVDYNDEPDSFEWTDGEGNRVTSVYWKGVVKSTSTDGKRTDVYDSDYWAEFKKSESVRRAI